MRLLLMNMKRLLSIAFLILLAPCTLKATTYLVSVGISDYPGTSLDLNLPVNDAQTITWVYSKNKDLRYCQLLNENATRANIIKAMDKVFSMAKANDVVVLYYSGHGYEGGFRVYDTNLSYNEIREAMSKTKCKNKMIFADACFSGQLRSNNNNGRANESAKKANVMLFLSSRNDEVSIENSAMKNGFFTTYLQKGLKGAADKNEDRIITAKELFDYVHKNVIRISNNQQHPVMWGKFSDNMPVMKW